MNNVSSEAETAEYITELLGGIRHISLSVKSPLLTAIIEMATIEAEKITQENKTTKKDEIKIVKLSDEKNKKHNGD